MKLGRIVVAAGCMLAGWGVPAAGAASLASGEQVIKSPQDNREYEAFVLDNGMKVLTVSDPEADKAAAAMEVAVGSGADPRDRQGLAHFLEHMLFLGTGRYPEAGEYQRFVSVHGGSHNAYTAYESTNYFFGIDPAYLEPALDRFSRFFIDPLFNPTYVDREVNAVDSEFRSKLEDDGRRRFAAFKQATNPEHPFSTFSAGNRETLLDGEKGLRDALIRFYENHYSADIMALTVIGREDTATLRRWVEEKFDAVPDRDLEPFGATVSLFRPDSLPARLQVEPVREMRRLELTFPVPPVSEHYRSAPVRYLGNLLGHEGRGSLLAELKHRGWAESLSAGAGLDYTDTATVSVSISLTEDGLRHVDDIVALFFRYTEMVREEGIEQWRFEELARSAELEFRFQNRVPAVRYASALSSSLHRYPIEDVLRGPYRMDRYDPDLIRDYLDRLRPDNMLVGITAPGVRTTAVTPWFKAPYALEEVGQEQIAAWRPNGGSATRLALPQPNEFLPEDLALKQVRDASPRPLRAVDEPGLQLWFRQDDRFRVPRADFFFSVRSPVANDTPRHAALTALYVRMVEDQLNEFAYPARLAGLDYNIYRHARGFSVRISGFDDKQPRLLDRVLQAARAPALEAERFARVREEYLRSLRNVRLQPPYRQALREVRDMLVDPHWPETELLQAAEGIDLEALSAFVPELLGRVDVVALAHGNLLEEQALSMAARLRRALVEPAEPVNTPRPAVVRLDSGESDRIVRHLEGNQGDSALVLYVQGVDTSYAERARFALAEQVLSSPYYTELRTEQQLGYIVMTTLMGMYEAPGLGFLVQSPVADPVRLESRTREFLARFRRSLDDLDEAALEDQRQGLLSRLLKEPESMRELSDRYWMEIDDEEFGFDSRERIAAQVRNIDVADFLAFYDRAFLSADANSLAVRVFGRSHAGARVAAEGSVEGLLVEDVAALKQAGHYFEREPGARAAAVQPLALGEAGRSPAASGPRRDP